MISNDEIVANLKYEIQQAQGYDSDFLSDKRAKAYDYYYGKPLNILPGRSTFVSTDVADTVTALMSQSSMIFKSSSVEFQANNEQDEEQAKTESRIVKAVLEQNNDFEVFEQSTFDALLIGNGWIKVGVEIEEKTVTQKLVAQSDDEAQFLIASIKATNPDALVSINPTASGIELVVQMDIASNELCVEAVPPENIIFSGTEQTRNIDELTFFAERKIYTVSDLIGMGLSRDEAMSVPDYGDNYWEASRARAGIASSEMGVTDPAQEAAQLKETFICYYLLDDSDSGETQRYRIHLAGDFIIEKEEASEIPYVTGSPLPIPHQIIGRGMYEVMKPIQDSKTSITRNYLDNLAVMNQSRVGYLKGEVDVQDLLNGRINGIVGMERPDAIIPLPSNDIGAQAIAGLNYMDAVRTGKGGASMDLNTAQMQVMKSSAVAAVGELDFKEQAAAYYAKNLAQTLLKNTFLLVHRVLRRDFNESIDAKVNGQWIQVNPGDWQDRKRARVVVGLSNSEKSAKINALNSVLMWQQQAMQAGLDGVLVDLNGIYNAAIDWISAANVSDHPEEYLINPMSPEAQQAQQQKAQSAEAQQAQMQAMQEEMAQLQILLQQMKGDQEMEKTREELRWKYYDTQMDAGVKEAQLTVNAMDSMANRKLNGSTNNNTKGSEAN